MRKGIGDKVLRPKLSLEAVWVLEQVEKPLEPLIADAHLSLHPKPMQEELRNPYSV